MLPQSGLSYILVSKLSPFFIAFKFKQLLIDSFLRSGTATRDMVSKALLACILPDLFVRDVKESQALHFLIDKKM